MRRFLTLIIALFLAAPVCAFLVPTFDPAPAAPPSPGANPAPDELLGCVLMIGVRGNALDEKTRETITNGKIAAFVILDREAGNEGAPIGASPDKIRELTGGLRAASGKDPLVAIRQEGGQIRPLKPDKGFLDLPAPQRLGQGNVHETFEIAEKLGKELADLGFNANLAPTGDVDVNPFNPLVGKLGRAFNTDPRQVAQHALAFGRGLAKSGVIPTLTDFPGIGSAPDKANQNAPDISGAWDPETDLRPYAEIIKAGWPGMIMTANAYARQVDKELPASLSPTIITGLLREGLGWKGVVVTDDLQTLAKERGLKETLKQALIAGADLCLLENSVAWDPDLIQNALTALRELRDEGSLPNERLLQSWRRLNDLREAYAH